MALNIRDYNRAAWNKAVERRSEFTVPVGPGLIERARTGDWQIVLTTETPVPRGWFPHSLDGVDVLCLASGRGAAGADSGGGGRDRDGL